MTQISPAPGPGARTAGPVGVALVGAGVISTQYLTALSAFPDVRVLAVADLDVARARAAADAHQVPQAGDVASVLAIPEVEIVVNLTIPAAHAEVAAAALAAGKHVYGEKPLALAPADGAKILAEAQSRGLRVGSAPDTFLGAGLQSAARALAAGAIGEPVSATAVTQGPGPEGWHPSPEFLYQYGAGPLFDIGPYYLTALVALFGPVTRVAATARQARARRVIGSGPRAGSEFTVDVPTHVHALLDFAGGPSASATFSFDASVPRRMIEITGTEGTLSLPDPNTFDGPLRIRAFGEEEWRDLPVTGTTAGRGIGVLDLARSIRGGTPHRASGELAQHVLELMSGVTDSAERHGFVELASGAPEVRILPDDWDPVTATLT
ncbi:Predicted dehydrogenase [Streptomyces sp. DvalAA-14]|uniref:Gfo/Idh/MocA family protein n=1 Tax=unclassified Streptomyces TaxID=2593676 RepID=UPI00081BA167|nr:MULTISPECIES: Gfo/Idh/MocA family oxidoreductase [unclassified Streptomyces]MYS18726.1 Gfo/Idh/MocA family oxidoreductase [Streptomyces sp. SID4948]SCD28252.1 Predicted dehydrogenase [Streptomyces sp. DvalAA-14]